jgi:hypothetical protein
VQNKLVRIVNKCKISDKIDTKIILDKINMLSINQLNAQIKLTECERAITRQILHYSCQNKQVVTTRKLRGHAPPGDYSNPKLSP